MAESTYTAPATYTITFPSLSQSEVKVSINGVLQSSGFTISGYATSGSGTVSFTSAPASGAHVRIFRDTTILSNQAPAPKADFQAGASIQAADLNNNMDQVLYKLAEKVDSGDISADSVVTQAIRDLNVTTAKIANNAVTAAKIDSNILTSHSTQVTDAANSAATATAAATTATNQATAAANQATAAANSAATAATEAASIAGSATAAQNAATAAQTQATASAASAATATTNATAALNNSREDDGSGGFTSAIDIANTAKNTADAASAASTTADSNATTALNNSRESDGSGGFTSAIAKATTAVNTANSASAAVANAVFYTLIANFAAFPSSPSNQDRIEVADSTGLQSQSIVTGLPSSFVGSSDLTVRLEYNSSTSKWDFKQYFAADPESRYIPKSGGTFTGNVGFDNDVVVRGTTSGTSGEITFNCGTNSHGVKIKGPPHSAAASYTLTLPTTVGASSNFLTTDGAGNLSWRGSDYLSSNNSIINVGTSGIQFTTNSTNQLTLDNQGDLTLMYGDLKFWGGSTNSFVTIKRASGSTTYDLTLPSNSGTPGQSLITNGSGVTSWANVDADLLDGQHGAYYTGYTDTAVANLVDSSPATLNTLNELAAALGDDANFSTTVTNSIATKLPLAGGTLTGGLTGTTASFSSNVGIGTSSPQALLHVKSNSLGIPAKGVAGTMQVGDGSGFGLMVGTDSSGVGYLQPQRNDGNTTTYNLALNPNGGNVGIGTSSPQDKLHVNGTIRDSIGPLRRLGVNAQSGAYTFVVGDAGKIIRSAGSGAALTLNQNIFTAGDMISVFNVSGGTNTIVQGTGVTLHNTADAATGNRTIAAKGMATLVCTDSNEFAISGSQLT